MITFSNSDIFRSILFFETYISYALTGFIDIIWGKCRNNSIYAAAPEKKLHDEFRSSLELRNIFEFLELSTSMFSYIKGDFFFFNNVRKFIFYPEEKLVSALYKW